MKYYLGDIASDEVKDMSIPMPRVGQVLQMSYHQLPGDEEPILKLSPDQDVLLKEISHDRHTEADGMILHTIRYEVVRIGV